MRKERCGERGTPAQGQPGLEGEGHVGSQGRRDVLEQGPTHAAGKMLTCLNVDWTLPWDVRLEGRLSGPVPEPWGVCHLGSALRGAGSEDEPGASDAQRGCPTAGLVSPVICGWDSPTHRSMNGGITVPRCHPPCPSPLLPAERGSGRSPSGRWFSGRRGRRVGGPPRGVQGKGHRLPLRVPEPQPRVCKGSGPFGVRGRLPAFFPRVSPFLSFSSGSRWRLARLGCPERHPGVTCVLQSRSHPAVPPASPPSFLVLVVSLSRFLSLTDRRARHA